MESLIMTGIAKFLPSAGRPTSISCEGGVPRGGDVCLTALLVAISLTFRCLQTSYKDLSLKTFFLRKTQEFVIKISHLRKIDQNKTFVSSKKAWHSS